MEVFAGEFNSTGGTGNQAVTGIGFIPNAIIFCLCAAGADDTWSDDAGIAFGFATGLAGVETVSGGGYTRDERTSSGGHTERWNDDAGIRLLDHASTVLLDFTIDSFDANGFTIDKATGGVFKVKFLAIKCDEAFAGSDLSRGSAGSDSWTGVGFAGDLIIAGGSFLHATEPANASSGINNYGASDGINEFSHSSVRGRVTNSTSDQAFDDSAFISHRNPAGTLLKEATLTSFDAGGVTLNWLSDNAATFIQFLILKDSEGFAVKNDYDSAASTGDETVTGLGRKPRALILTGINSSTVDASETDVKVTWGVADDAGNENSVAIADEDDASPATSDTFIDTDDCYHGGTPGAPAVTHRVGDWQSMNSDGFIINWESVTGSVRIGVIAFGDSVAPVTVQGSMRGRNLIMPFSGAHRGRHRVINRLDQSLRGRSKASFDQFDLSLRGRSRVLNVYDQSMRGRHEVKLLLTQSLRGRNKTEGPALVFFTQSLRGVHGVQQEYNQSLKARNRMANDAIDLFELWIRADVEPDLSTDPTETFVSLPHTTAALTPPLSGTRKYFLILRKRNQYNLSSENFSFWAVTIDEFGNEVLIAPSAPAEYAVAPAAAINANVTAEYFYLPDGDNQADTWAIFLTSSGVNPDLAGAPFTTLAMQKVDGLAKFDEDLGPFIEGDTVKVIVTTRRGAVQSLNNEIVETIVTALGPAKVDADIHLGDQAGISSTEGDNSG